MQKNIASQKWRVFAFDRTTNAPLTGDAANITAKISKDFGTANATNDTNPAEIEDGYYEFDLTQAETNADDLLILPESATANIVVVGCPARIATTPASWADDVVQTGDSFARIGTNGAGLTDLAQASAYTATRAGYLDNINNAALQTTAAQTGDAYAYVVSNLGAAGAAATEAGGTGDQLTAINLPNQTMDIVGNITGNLSGSVGSVTGAVGSVTGAVGSVTGNVGGNVVGSVGSISGVTFPANFGDFAITVTTGTVTVGTNSDKTGYGLADDAITAAKFDESTAFPVTSADSSTTRIARTGADSDTLETLSDQIDGVSASAIADAVWDEATSGHQTAGTTGLALTSASAPTASQVADAVWDEAQSGHTTAGTFGKYLDAAISGIGGLGTGARTVTITVNDGATALESARVRMIKGAENYVGSTNASGVIVFSLDDGTWSVAISLPGYTFTPTTLVVDGAETQTYSMTLTALTPSEPGRTTGYIYCYGEDGEPEQGVTLRIVTSIPSGSGIAYDTTERTETSDADGLVSFTNLFKGQRYTMYRGTSTQPHRVLVPSDAGATYLLPSISGGP